MTVRHGVVRRFLACSAILAVGMGACGERVPRRSRLTRPCDSARAGKVIDSLCREDLASGSTDVPAPHWPECDEHVRRLPIGGADSLSTQTKCVIVTAAIRALGRQPDSLAPPFASDTATVMSATIGHFQFRAITGQLVPGYWSVDLRLRSRSYGAAVQVGDDGKPLSVAPTGLPF